LPKKLSRTNPDFKDFFNMKNSDSTEPLAPITKVETGGLPRKGIVLLISLGLFWGMAWPAIKISVSELQPWTFRTYCLVLGGIGVLILAKANGFSLRIPLNQLKHLCLVALLNITGWQLFSAHGVLRMNASRAVIIAFTMPLWATIFSAFILKERITRIRILALGLGIVALAILIWPEIEAVGTTPVGAMFMLGAALSWATGTVLLKRFKWSMPTTVLTGWQLILGSIPVVIGALVLEQVTVIFRISASAVLALSYIIAIPMIFCHWAYFTLVRIFPASVAAISTLAIPVIGVFSSALILNEQVGSNEIVALVLVVTALAMVILIDQRN
jgi:drug/metabolite transporter (DMT)-like permease